MPAENTRLNDRELLREIDILEVGQCDPGFEYRWVHNSDVKRTLAEINGYVAVQGSSKEGPKYSVNGKPVDSVKRLGDLILYRIPKDLYNQRMGARHRRTASRQENIARSFVHEVERLSPDGKVLALDPAQVRREEEARRKGE